MADFSLCKPVFSATDILQANTDYEITIFGACQAKDGWIMRDDFHSTFSTGESMPLTLNSVLAINPNTVRISFE